MNQENFKALVAEVLRESADLLVSKGEEYSNSEDRLANFKRGAAHTGVSPLTVLFIFMSKHYDAFSTYVRKEQQGLPQSLSEPIEGRLNDLINYCLLARALIAESVKESEAPPKPNKLTVYAGIHVSEKGEMSYVYSCPECGVMTALLNNPIVGSAIRCRSCDSIFYTGN